MKPLFLTLALGLVLLAGCGGGGSTRNSSNTGSYNKTNTRTYQTDCGNASTIGSGSCNVVVGGFLP